MKKTYLVALVGAMTPLASAQAATLDLSTFQLNGSATSSGANNIALTHGDQSEAASAFSPSMISTANDFSVSFTYTANGEPFSFSPQADGFAFLVQSAGITALGNSGGDIGAVGIVPSAGVAFRSFAYNVSGIFQNGNVYGLNNSQPFAFGDTNSGQVTVNYVAATNLFSYNAVSLTSGAHASGSETLDLKSLLGPTAYFGFSGGTGAFTSFESISDVSLTSAVPEPATWAMMLAGFGIIGFAARRRQSVKTTATYA